MMGSGRNGAAVGLRRYTSSPNSSAGVKSNLGSNRCLSRFQRCWFCTTNTRLIIVSQPFFEAVAGDLAGHVELVPQRIDDLLVHGILSHKIDVQHVVRLSNPVRTVLRLKTVDQLEAVGIVNDRLGRGQGQ